MDSSYLRLRGSLREHKEGHVQYYDAKNGNLVVIDASSESYSSDEKEALLGDWEMEVQVGIVRKKVPRRITTPDGEEETVFDLLIAHCEPWVVDDSNNPVLPVWAAQHLTRLKQNDPDSYSSITAAASSPLPEYVEINGTSWDDVSKLPWLPITALPLPTLYAFYMSSLNGIEPRPGKDSTKSFKGIQGLPAFTNMKRLGQSKFNNNYVLHGQYDFNHLLFTLQVEKNEIDKGVKIQNEALERMKVLGQINQLRTLLNIDVEAIDRRTKLTEEIEKELTLIRKGKKQANEKMRQRQQECEASRRP